MTKGNGGVWDGFGSPAGGPIPPLASQMKVDFLFNATGGVWLLHEKPLPETPAWAEYDADEGTVTMVTETGRSMALGLKVPGDFGLCMKDAAEMTALRLDEKGNVLDMLIVSMVTRNTAVE